MIEELKMKGREDMTELLVRSFVKDADNIDNTQVRERYGMLSSMVGVFCNILLFVGKGSP